MSAKSLRYIHFVSETWSGVEEPGQAKRSQDVEEADHAKLTETTAETRGPKTSSQKVIC